MTFDEWMLTIAPKHKPTDDGVTLRILREGWENSCRQAWAVAALTEQRRWEEALRKTWQMVDPLNPAGSPGSYARGQDSGIVAALKTLRENLGKPKPERWPSADHAWAEAGKHAEELRQAVRALAALNAWHHFGECRAFGPDPILAPHEADELARRVLRA